MLDIVGQQLIMISVYCIATALPPGRGENVT